jgi:hypothetical protein
MPYMNKPLSENMSLVVDGYKKNIVMKKSEVVHCKVELFYSRL